MIEFIRDFYSLYEHRLDTDFYRIQSILHVSVLYTRVQQLLNIPFQIKSIDSTGHNLNEDELMNGCRLGIDTHADSSCAGKHVRPLEFISGKKYSVTPFHESYAPKTDVGMINGVVAIDKPDGEGYILELNNFLNFTDSMNDSILVPMQALQNNIVIDDVPKGMCYHGVSTQSIFIPDTNIKIPIEFNGPIPYVKIRYPSDTDLDNYGWVELTSQAEWNPYPEDNGDVYYNSSINSTIMDDDFQNSFYYNAKETIIINKVETKAKNTSLSPELLSKLWRIPLQSAKRTLSVTTNNYIRTNEGKLSRRFRTDLFQKRYRRMGGNFSRFYTDTLFFKCKTLDLSTCAQIFCNKARFTCIFPMLTKSQAHEALTSFVQEVGIPNVLHSDDAKELSQGEMRKKMTKYGIFHTMAEPYSPWENYAEDSIRVVKNWARYFMQATNTPIRLIDHAMLYVCELRNRTAASSIATKGRTPFEITFGFSPDISEYTAFEWYQYIWYWEPKQPQKQLLGRWIGVSDHIGNGLTYKVINEKGEVISRSTVIPLSKDDLENRDIQGKLKTLDDSIHLKIGDYTNSIVRGAVVMENDPYQNIFIDDEDPHPTDAREPYENIEFPDADNEHFQEALAEELEDRYIGVKVLLPRSGKKHEATVISRKRTQDDKALIGLPNSNPLLDSRIYTVEFPDGGTGEYATNVIAESIYSNVDDEGFDLGLIDGIIAHRKLDNAIPVDKGHVEHNGIKKRVITTKGWDLRVRWKDGSTSWIPLKELKASNPLEIAEYAIANNLSNEPAFAWWISHTLRTRSRMVSRIKINKKIRKRTKFGIVVPMSLEEAKQLDIENGNDFWERAVKKEIDKVRVAFMLLENDEKPLIGSKLINYHIIFDVKMDLTRKARLVAGGHLNKEVPRHITYSSVVSKESVRLCFLLAALNGLDVLSSDIGNAYLNAKPREKCHVVVTDALLFGEAAIGKKAQIVRALYGMKSSGAAWRDMLSSYIKYEMGFQMCLADNDIWYHADTKNDGTKYYSYICIYVDDILICSQNTHEYMTKIGSKFLLKPESIKEPNVYLGADFKKKTLDDGSDLWITGANSYLKEALRISDGLLNKHGMKVNGGANQPFSNISYRPELDITPLCDTEQLHIFQQLVGILRWLVELGRVDINLEVSKLSSFLAGPRIGHLHQAFHIFKYLRNHENSWIPLDPCKLIVNWNGTDEQSPGTRREMMKKIYQDAEEDIPMNAPEPRGESVQVNCYVDADHAGDKVTRRSHTGILIFVNMAIISWFSKKQNTVEASTFGSEYIAMRIAVEKVKALRYKLRMMGVPIEGAANIFADNESVVRSSMNPESTLSKKHVSIAYHLTREAFAANIVNIFFIPSRENLADLLTKVLPCNIRRDLFKCIFW